MHHSEGIPPDPVQQIDLRNKKGGRGGIVLRFLNPIKAVLLVLEFGERDVGNKLTRALAQIVALREQVQQSETQLLDGIGRVSLRRDESGCAVGKNKVAELVELHQKGREVSQSSSDQLGSFLIVRYL